MIDSEAESPEVLFASDGERIEREGYVLHLEYFSLLQQTQVTMRFDASTLPFREILMQWVEFRCEDLASKTLMTYLRMFKYLVEFAESLENPLPDLTPEVFRSYLRWLKQLRDDEGNPRLNLVSVNQIANPARSLYAFGAERGYGSWSIRNLDLISRCQATELRGRHEEARHRSINGAFSAYEYENLIVAAGMEMEECRKVLATRKRWAENRFTPRPSRPASLRLSAASNQAYFRAVLAWFRENDLPVDPKRFCAEAGCNEGTVRTYPEIWEQVGGAAPWVVVANSKWPLGMHNFTDPSPYTAFAILVGLRNGVRAEELNVMKVEDLDPETGYLFLHAPNKEYGEEHQSDVKVEQAVIDAYELVLHWSQAARAVIEDKTPLMLFLSFMGKPQRGENKRLSAGRGTTNELNRYWLPRFYRKYFEHQIVENDAERPVLHREGDPSQPFSAPFKKYRNAAIRNYLENELNLVHVQRFARHKHLKTTGRHYAHTHQADNDYAVAMALGPTARVFQIALQNRVIVEMTDELREREAEGGATPWGVCGDPALNERRPRREGALSPSGCSRAGSCLECPDLYLHVEKRSLLEAEMEFLLLQAEDLAQQGFVRDAENARASASLRQAHINRIDELQQCRK